MSTPVSTLSTIIVLESEIFNRLISYISFKVFNVSGLFFVVEFQICLKFFRRTIGFFGTDFFRFFDKWQDCFFFFIDLAVGFR